MAYIRAAMYIHNEIKTSNGGSLIITFYLAKIRLKTISFIQSFLYKKKQPIFVVTFQVCPLECVSIVLSNQITGMKQVSNVENICGKAMLTTVK